MKIFLLSVVFYVIYLFFKTKKSLHMLQQNRYNRGYKYLKWIKGNLKKNYWNFEILIFFLPCFFFLSDRFLGIVFNTFYFLFLSFFFYRSKKEQKKVPLHITARIKRLLGTTFILYFLFLLGCYFIESRVFSFFLLGIGMYFNNIIVVLANFFNRPIEKIVNRHFYLKAQKKLQNLSGLEVIGITGSYGKTSSKNILNDVLSSKYTVFKTPKNYNTPTGLMISINEYLDKFNDFFIAEMGACRKGEIKELCDLVRPKYGILTKIGVAHLETFGSEEAIQKTKFELIESLPSDGIGILNADDENQVNYKLKNKVQTIWIGIDHVQKCDVYATDIKLSGEGTSFKCHFKKSKKTLLLTTKLLGKANIYNILASVALGEALGLGEQELILGVKKVEPVLHRLQLKRYYDMYLIDDAYNANPEGAKMALDVLKLMKGKKIVISSGMIELGSKNDSYNKELGSYMANIVDIAILIGEKQTKSVQEGLLENKFKKENIMIFNDILESLAYLKKLNEKGAYILLQSDLPDAFNEI